MSELSESIQKLKKEKDAVILAHYYVPDEVQEVADYIGDSYYLSRLATKVDAKVVVLCGVTFMGESAKLLNPEKTVLLPDIKADCPMAHMCTVEKIDEIRSTYPDAAVVCYVNSTAELKANADVCVTSSNALDIVRKLPNKEIFFIPDKNLGQYVASQVPDKHIILNDGYCHVHSRIMPADIEAGKRLHPKAEVLVHPECMQEVVALADYVGSTAGIIQYATNSECSEFIVATEIGVFCDLKKRNPEKQFYSASSCQICPSMKRLTLEKVLQTLQEGKPEITLSDELMTKANLPLKRMLQMTE